MEQNLCTIDEIKAFDNSKYKEGTVICRFFWEYHLQEITGLQ